MTWPTAFWALAAIALNSMMAPNGMVLSFPSSWGFALRSSPMLCLFDALDLTLFWSTLVVFGGEGPRTAARRVVRVRFRDAGDDESSDQSLVSVRKRFWFVQALFVLTTLTQAVKLFACRGIVGTQLCAAFYLYSYVISEALIWAAGDDWKSVSNPHLEPGPLRDVAMNGMLPWVPSHVFGVLVHSAWFGNLFWDVAAWLTIDATTFEGGFYLVVMVTLESIIPFVLQNTDSARSIDLSPRQLQLLPLFVFLVTLASLSWNRIIDAVARTGPFVHGAYIVDLTMVTFLDQPLCAFTRRTQASITGLIPMVQFVGKEILFLFFPRPCPRDSDKSKFVRSSIPLISLSVLLILHNFPSSLVRQATGRVPLLRRLRVPLFARMYPFAAMSSIFFSLFAVTRLTLYTKRTIQLAVLVTYLPLTFLNEMLGAVPGRFPPELAGASFVFMNSALSLLWFWKVWAQYQPACTVKPGWTDVFG